MSSVCNCHGMVYLDCPNYRASLQRGEPAAAPQPEKGWLKPILEQARADINARPAWQKSRVVPAAPAPAPLLSASDIAKKLVNAGGIDRREKILKQWVDSYIARWAAELEQVKAERDQMRDALVRLRDNDAEYCECDHSDDNCCNKVGEHCTWCICEAALGEKGKQ